MHITFKTIIPLVSKISPAARSSIIIGIQALHAQLHDPDGP